MSWQSETRAWAMASAVAFCLCAVGYRVMTAPKLPDLNSTVAHIDAATGAWADASAQQVRSVAAIERDLRAELWHVDRLLLAGSQTLQAAQGAIDTANVQLTHVAPLLDATRGAVEAIPPALQRVTEDAEGIRPLLANADGAVRDFRRFLTAPALADTLSNVDALTAAWARISTNGAKITDKMTADYFRPVPWYLYPVKKGSELLDIGAAAARHIP
jgi:hypothetical protein